MPTLTLDTFRSRFDQLVTELSISWELLGFYAADGKVYPFGTDTKVLSTAFETLAAPLVEQIADEFDYSVEHPEQTIYPDFTLIPRWDQSAPKIAVDVKTTYQDVTKKGVAGQMRFTLGSYTSYLRQPTATKNIKYPYASYSDHWVLGFVYRRTGGVRSKVYYRPENIADLKCPYQDVDYFIQEKHRITGLAPGSGNTTNIGSFSTNNIEDFKRGVGPFSDYPKEFCDSYWKHYGKDSEKRLHFSNIAEFQRWLDSRK